VLEGGKFSSNKANCNSQNSDVNMENLESHHKEGSIQQKFVL